MTTNQSLTDAFKHTYKTGLKGLPILPALANFGVLAFFVTFFTGAEILSRQPIINDEGQTTGYISASNRYISFFFSDTDYMLIPALVLVAICGLSMAICTFNFITSKKQVNVYYSLGITRTRLFLGKYLAGATLLVVSTFIPLFITLIMNLGALGFSGTVFNFL
jgi:ABC-type transport system involved in multi-copper enzyme maturation permease subunit